MVHDPRFRHDVEQPSTSEYDVEVNGVTTTLRLSEQDARARGLLGDEGTIDPAAPVAIQAVGTSDDDPNLPNVGTTQTTDPLASAGAVGDGTGAAGAEAAARNNTATATDPATDDPDGDVVLKGEALDQALRDADLTLTGTADEKRARLAEHQAATAATTDGTGTVQSTDGTGTVENK